MTLTVPTEYSTLQAAVDVASSGDRILVLPGLYVGIGNRDVDLHDKSLSIHGVGGLGDVTFDSENQGRFMLLSTSGIPTSAELVNVRIVNGFSVSDGGGIHCQGSTLSLHGCALEENSSDIGGAIWSVDSDLTITESAFIRNNCSDGGAIGAQRSHVTCDGTVFFNNSAGGIAGAIYLVDSSFDGTSCSFVLNVAFAFGAVLATNGGELTRLERCIVAFSFGSRPFECRNLGEIVMSCSDVYGNQATDWADCLTGQLGLRGNFQANPEFCDFNAGDLRLMSGSPCLPGNHPDDVDCGVIGASGEVCGGPSATEATSWGRLKAQF